MKEMQKFIHPIVYEIRFRARQGSLLVVVEKVLLVPEREREIKCKDGEEIDK